MSLEQGYTTIDEILARINMNPFMQGEDFDSNYVILIISDALRMSLIREMYQFDCKVLSFDNYRVNYPDGFKLLIDIGYSKYKECTEKEDIIKDINENLIKKIACKSEDECGNDVYQGWDYNKFMLEYNYFSANLDTLVQKRKKTNETSGNFVPMQPSTSNFVTEYDRKDAYTYYLDSNFIRFNVKEGSVLISFLKHPTDENGNLLIPNDIEVLRFIESYYYYKMLQDKYYSSLEGDYYNRFRMAQEEFYSNLAAVKGKAKVPDFKRAVNIGRIKNSSLLNRENMGTNSFFGYLPRIQQPNFNKWYN